MKHALNNKGVFITLTAFLFALLILAAFTNLLNTRNIEESAVTLSLATHRSYYQTISALDAARSIYADAGISWVIDYNKLTYTETFPNTYSKNKISVNLAKLKSFYYQQYPTNPNFSPENVDIGRINVFGKDINITHSPSGGFSNNQTIYFKYTGPKFAKLQFDINSSAGTIGTLTQSLPLCSSCTKPVILVINVRNSAGTIAYTFNNTVDFGQNGALDLNSAPAVADIQLKYSPTDLNWTANSNTLTLVSKITFNDTIFDVGLDRNIIQVTEMSSFGVQS